VSRFLTVADVLKIHADQIKVYGGTLGVRDPGLLQSALYRPQSGYYPDVYAEAVALWESLSQNHPFFDGNKRTAFGAVYTFLWINGLIILADADAVTSFVYDLYQTHRFSFDLVDAWLRVNTARKSAE
jgi:death-on-curing protein